MLTEAIIKKAIKAGAKTQLSDGNARGAGRLVLRIKGDDAEWYAQQWVGDRRRLSKIGSYPALTLAQARIEFATNHHLKIVKGEDIRSTPVTGTIGRLFEDYVRYMKSNGMRSAPDVEYALGKIVKVIGENRPANQVTAKDIVEAIRPTYESGCRSMADHYRGYIRSAYSWAIKSQNDYRAHRADVYRLTVNPAEHIPVEPKVPGDRWLSLEELRAFWKWNGTSNINRNTDPRNYAAIRLLMLTGQRSEEIARLTCSMINRDLNLIEWPKTKNGKAHVVPMTELIRSIIDSVQPNEHGLLFPSEVFPDRCVTDQTMRMVCVRYCRATGAKSFTPRDLRRTWKTWTGHAGLSKDIRDRLQNHTRGDVSSIHYDRYDYLAEKREAMEKWCAWFIENVDKKKAP